MERVDALAASRREACPASITIFYVMAKRSVYISAIMDTETAHIEIHVLLLADPFVQFQRASILRSIFSFILRSFVKKINMKAKLFFKSAKKKRFGKNTHFENFFQ